CDAERRANLVLTAVAAADGLRVVELGAEVGAQRVPDLASFRREALVAGQRQHGNAGGGRGGRGGQDDGVAATGLRVPLRRRRRGWRTSGGPPRRRARSRAG